MASEDRLPEWHDLGIRRSDLLVAERLAGALRRSAAERRRALVATGLPLGFATFLCVLLIVVAGAF